MTLFFASGGHRPRRGVSGDVEYAKSALDDFSAAHIAKYKVAFFDDPEVKIVLRKVAQTMKMNIADIESRHASLRRMLKCVVQTHMLDKASMSDQAVGRSLGKRQQGAGGRRWSQ